MPLSGIRGCVLQSKFNPIEHRFFSQISRSWSGAPLLSLKKAADRAARTATKTGLTVFAPELGKWNYLVKPAN